MDLLCAIAEYWGEHGMAPTVRELCVAMGGRSTSTAEYHLHRLESIGYVRRVPRVARGLFVEPLGQWAVARYTR